MKYYTADLYRFLRQLSRQNNRQCFAEHREEYDRLRQLWYADLDRMIAAMSVWCPQIAGQTGKSASYRIYRDTRFSPDKTPFKTYFSAAVGPYDKKSEHAGYYIQLGLDADDSGLYGGIWCPSSPILAKLRHAIVDNIEEFTEITANPELNKYFSDWTGERLKTIPKGWERNHPYADLLRLKEYGRYHACDEQFFADSDWPLRAASLFHILSPLVDFLNYSIDE